MLSHISCQPGALSKPCFCGSPQTGTAPACEEMIPMNKAPTIPSKDKLVLATSRQLKAGFRRYSASKFITYTCTSSRALPQKESRLAFKQASENLSNLHQTLMHLALKRTAFHIGSLPAKKCLSASGETT
eukprot:473814-Pelagomonas_calceolata.AAC.6